MILLVRVLFVPLSLEVAVVAHYSSALDNHEEGEGRGGRGVCQHNVGAHGAPVGLYQAWMASDAANFGLTQLILNIAFLTPNFDLKAERASLPERSFLSHLYGPHFERALPFALQRPVRTVVDVQ